MKTIISTFVTLTIIILTLTSCNDNQCINGEGTITTQILEVADFHKINSSISSEIIISQGETQEVKITGHPNIISELQTSVINSQLDIDIKNGCYNDYKLTIEITIPEITLININGSGNVVINNFSNQNSLETSIVGSGHITINEFEGATDLIMNISGSGLFEANKDISTLTNLVIDISGSGDFDGYEISSDTVNAKISGSGKAYVTATDILDVTISGSGKLYYRGTPNITQNINGSGKLINAN